MSRGKVPLLAPDSRDFDFCAHPSDCDMFFLVAGIFECENRLHKNRANLLFQRGGFSVKDRSALRCWPLRLKPLS
jgi:hypothetical protein